MQLTIFPDSIIDTILFLDFRAPLAIIEFVDRDVEAKRVDRKKKETKKSTEEKKTAPAA